MAASTTFHAACVRECFSAGIVIRTIGIALTGVGGYAFVIAIHRLATTLLVILVFLHIYTTFIYKLVRSSIFGYKEEPVA